MSNLVIPHHTVIQQTYQQIHLVILKRALSSLKELHSASSTVTVAEYSQEYLLSMLRHYPAIGRLLLNRPPSNAELQQLHQQIQRKLKGGELREYYFEGRLVIYLVKSAVIYLLSFHPLDEQTAELWERQSLLD